MAVATAHLFDPTIEVKGLDRTGVLLSGEGMRAIHGKASALTEEEAAVAAVRALFFQLGAREPRSTPR